MSYIKKYPLLPPLAKIERHDQLPEGAVVIGQCRQGEKENNPNYVFENDADFKPVQLFDIEGNIVFVNSFQECQHYVTGGWNFIPNQINESQYHSILSVFSILITFVGYFFIRKFLIGSANEKN